LGKYAKKSHATLWLVIASFSFYGYWDYHYVPLLFASILFNYIVGQKIETTRSKKWMIFGIVINVILLGYFKYTDFFLETLNNAVGADCFDLPHIVLPLGISFFTFTQTAYLVDAYRGDTVNRSFITYCEFVTIFPHLIAGPIINHKEMIPQFIADKTFTINYKNIAIGLSIFAMGLFKKVAIADNLAIWANSIFSHTESLTFLEAWIGAISYTFQLYFDFSAYSEMAIGLGLMFNLTLPVNFNSPYQSTSIIDFWRRWHMTLGVWVRDYLYIPIGGNRHGELAKMRNLFVAMTIIGLWHGAGWTFVFWGTMHGVALVINHQWRRLNICLPKFINLGITFFYVLLLWIFFRAENFQSAWNIILAMTDIFNSGIPSGGIYQSHFGVLANYGINFSKWTLQTPPHKIIIALIFLAIILLKVPNPIKMIDNFKPNKKWAAVIFLMILYSIFRLNNYSEFLYFQF
jgi:alginate O-acetyltransferase complex protein AlgI